MRSYWPMISNALSEGSGALCGVTVTSGVYAAIVSRADARGGQIERGRRAEPAHADQQHLRVEQLALSDAAHLRHDDVARVARHLVGRPRPIDGRRAVFA